MKLQIANQPINNDDVCEFKLVHDNGDVVLTSYHPLGSKSLEDAEVLRFKSNGTCIAAHRPSGVFHKRDPWGRFIIEEVSSEGSV